MAFKGDKVVMYTFAAKTVQGFLRIVGGKLTVHQKEAVPTDTPFIVVCTHKSWYDVVCLGIALHPVPIHFMAKKELFRLSVINKLLTSLHVFPVDRENPGPSAVKIPLQLLKKQKVVGIFPSGTRSAEDDSLKQGAVRIASRAGVPIVPAVYVGPHRFRDVLKRKRRTVIFGEPIPVSKDKSVEEWNEILSQTFRTLEK